MDRMLVVIFDNESKAYEGKTALIELDREGSIGVYGYAVVAKSADGTTSVKQGEDAGPLGALTGTALGSLVGLLGGPVGVAPFPCALSTIQHWERIASRLETGLPISSGYQAEPPDRARSSSVCGQKYDGSGYGIFSSL